MKCDGQIALIVGGASGMGFATAQFLKERGARVAVWDKAEKMPENGKIADFFTSCDVRDEASLQKALHETTEILGIPSIVINCAGIAPAARMVGRDAPMPLQSFKDVIDINLVGTFNVMRLLAFAMTKLPLTGEERGVIINTASIAAYEGQIGQMAYSASKGGIVSMTLPAARELASLAIRVNTVAPGLIGTPLLLGMPEEVKISLEATVPFPKRFGKPTEFAALVHHIIENTMINGEVIRLDGALRMQAK